jgi:membrane-associated phospholipid phosphatase
MINKFDKKDYKYLLYFLYIPVYAIWFSAVEIINKTGYYVSYMKIDDYIPFCEYFYIFYFSWYFYLAGITVYLLLTNREDFGKFMQFIIVGATIGLIIFTIFPNGQNLRPSTFDRDNFFITCIKGLYTIDTNTNVLPSLHVVGSFAGAIAIIKSKILKKYHLLQLLIIIQCILICLSTVFIKQHSVLDIITGIALCVPVYFFVYTNLFQWFFSLFVKNKKKKFIFY